MLVHETRALETVRRALDPLNPEERGRVLSWAAQRYGMLVRAEGIFVPRDAQAPSDREFTPPEPPEDRPQSMFGP